MLRSMVRVCLAGATGWTGSALAPALMADYRTIVWEKLDRVGRLTLNRPRSLNAINVQMGHELIDALTRMEEDAEIRAIAAQSGESPRRVRASLEKRGLMDVLRNQIIETKTLALITEGASFTDVPFEFPRPDTDAVDHAVCGAVVGEEEIPVATQAEAAPARGARR